MVPNLESMAWFGRNVSYTPHKEFIGVDTIQFVMQDRWGTFSDVVTLRMVVMENKCQNGGKCQSKNFTNIFFSWFIKIYTIIPFFTAEKSFHIQIC